MSVELNRSDNSAARPMSNQCSTRPITKLSASSKPQSKGLVCSGKHLAQGLSKLSQGQKVTFSNVAIESMAKNF